MTCVPGETEAGDTLVMAGTGGSTVNAYPALTTPATVTTTFPVVAPAGTAVRDARSLQLVGAASVPLNFTVLVPWVAPKLVPVIVTVAARRPR